METQNEMITRIKRLFESFLDENFVTMNNVYFDKLLTHLGARENNYIVQAPFAVEWVDKCITIITEDYDKLNPKVISFIFNFTSIVMRNEWSAIEIRELKLIDRFIFLMERDQQRFTPSVKLGSIRIFSSIMSYTLGVAYLRSVKAWRFLLNYCNKDHTLYVVREARQLLYELLYKFSVKTNDEQIVLDVLQEIFRPLHENVYRDDKDRITINVDDTELQYKLTPTLELLSYIFQQTLESEEKTNISYLCDEHHQFKHIVWKLVEMTYNNKAFIEQILTTYSSYNFALLVYNKWECGQPIAAESFNEFGVIFYNMMKFCVTRHEWLPFLKLSEFNHILWKKLGERAPKEILIENERIRFENQLITFHMMPVLFILRGSEWEKEELFDNFVMKLFEISCEHTLRTCYAFRDQLVNSAGVPDPEIVDLAYKSIHSMLSMGKVLEREQAVLVFKAIIYALKDYMLMTLPGSDCKGNEKTSVLENRCWLVEIPKVLYAALIGLQTLIQRYRITWKESIETICLVNCVAIILEKQDLCTTIVVQAIKLLQLAIEHFLSPNMALLVDNLEGSGLVNLGPIILKRFHDNAWEVRDSTLEFVTSIANISRSKFPAFQPFLAENNLCPVVFQMAKNDCEPFVRASAFKCLSQMVGINVIWDKDLSKLDIIEHIFFVLYNESEGIVRREAVSMLTKIYDQRKVPLQLKDTLYSTFAHCVVRDLHWEVKIYALCFWELEIEKQFTNQGMIDGTFPTVTFSREHKKIVTLTEKEINLRINKIFNELSQRGCLGVILQSLNDDCDLEVIKTAVCVVRRLLEKLTKYDYESIIGAVKDEPSTHMPAIELKTNIKDEAMDEAVTTLMDSVANADEVIESILSSQDINLVISAFDKQIKLNGEVEAPQHIDEHFYKNFASVRPIDFVKAIKRINLDKLLHNHHEWQMGSESFVSLLDDITCAIRPHDAAIFADCY